MAKKTHKTPAQARRNALAEAIKARGHSPYNIWVVRPPFDEEDLLLTSDIAFELFYYLEGDPRYVDIDYPGLKASCSEARVSIADFVFAVATDACGRVTTIKFSHAAPNDTGNSDMADTAESPTRIVTVEDLNANVQRIENWRRIIPTLRRVKLHPMAMVEQSILQALRDGQRKTIRQLLQTHGQEQPAKVVGAIAMALRHRYVEADVDSAPWSLNTLIWGEAA